MNRKLKWLWNKPRNLRIIMRLLKKKKRKMPNLRCSQKFRKFSAKHHSKTTNRCFILTSTTKSINSRWKPSGEGVFYLQNSKRRNQANLIRLWWCSSTFASIASTTIKVSKSCATIPLAEIRLKQTIQSSSASNVQRNSIQCSLCKSETHRTSAHQKRWKLGTTMPSTSESCLKIIWKSIPSTSLLSKLM